MGIGRWKPGESGNPKGRPKKDLTFRDVLKKELNHRIPYLEGEEESVITKRRAICLKLMELALRGDVPALKYLMDRIDGAPKEKQEITMSGGLDVVNMTPSEREARIAELLAKEPK